MVSYLRRITGLISELKGKLWGKAEDKDITSVDLSPTRPYRLSGVTNARVVIKQGDSLKSMELEPGLLVGRSSNCDLILDDPSASRIHASFHVDGGVWFIQDNASTNGTLVNGRKVRRTSLKTGDEIGIGRIVLVFEER